MARPSDREYALRRKIKDLEDQLDQKETEIKRLKKQLDKEQEPVIKSKSKPIKKEQVCPDCGASIKESVLPFGRLRLCSSACGFRETIK